MKGMPTSASSVRITFEEAVFGCEKELDADPERSLHQAATAPEQSRGLLRLPVPSAAAKARWSITQQSLFGTVQNVQTCPDCHGTGKIIKEKCPDCGGTGYVSNRKKISVSIPAGIDNGQSVRIREQRRAGSERRAAEGICW